MEYQPVSPDLSTGYAPQSPDLTGLRLPSPDPNPSRFPLHRHDEHLQLYHSLSTPSDYQPPQLPFSMSSASRPPPRNPDPDDDFLPDAPAKRPRRTRRTTQQAPDAEPRFQPPPPQQVPAAAPQPPAPSPVDPAMGVQLRTSFPVARIKRIMQADEDVGKVAQVTPHVVSRALELFMIKLVAATAAQAAASGTGAPAKGVAPRKVLVQHMKQAVAADETFDFLQDIMANVPDGPAKAKKESGSDSEGAGSGAAAKASTKKGRRKGAVTDDV